jgi:predicted YcjX-like family ATPase
MPLLKAVSDGRLLAARVGRRKGDRLPRFPYRRNI